MKTLQDWLTFIDGLHPRSMDLELGRVGMVRQRMGLNPSFPLITVAGTNGKGSTCAYLTAMLRAAGYRVGTYTSPHLVHYAERVALQGIPVSDAQLCRSFERVEAARHGVGLTPFEFGTLVAVDLFVDEQVDVAVLEVGLGGRLDAVNLFEPTLSVITGIALDHEAWLGTTREAIAREKAGILRAAVPALCGDPDPPFSLQEVARSLAVPMWYWNKDFTVQRDEDGRWDLVLPDGAWRNLPPPPLLGDVQYRNAALALAALTRLPLARPLTQEAVARGLGEVSLAGRFQILSSAPLLILDVAHNPEAAMVLADNLAHQPCQGETHLILGMLRDKDIASVVMALDGAAEHWYVAALGGERGAGKAEMEPFWEHRGRSPTWFESPWLALQEARRRAAPEDRIVVCGSFVTVGQILEHRDSLMSEGTA